MNNQYTLTALSPEGMQNEDGKPEAMIPVNPAPLKDLRELAAYFAQGIDADKSWWIIACDEFGEEIIQWGCDDLDRYRRLLDGESMTTTQTLLATGGL